MKEINDEINLTINLMQTDIDDAAHSELQSHLYSLLEMKRAEISRRMAERSWVDDQSPYKSGPIIGRAEPLTVEELEAGGWWCADISKECADAFNSKGLQVFNSDDWGESREEWGGCILSNTGRVSRKVHNARGKKQIHRIGNDFYWGKP